MIPNFAYGTVLTAAVLGAIFVNGATDAPGTVAGAVAGGTLTRRRAAVICALFNFAGMALSSILYPKIGRSIAEIAAGDAAPAASLASVIIFAAVAWRFGIPTSESHALIAALGGAALYYNGTPGRAFFGITLKGTASCAAGYAAGFAVCRVLRHISGGRGSVYCRTHSRRSGTHRSHIIAAVCAAGASACHGAQDGQKLTSLLIPKSGVIPPSAVFIPSAVMAAGCLAGGGRIIERVGRGISGSPDTIESTSSDVSSFICTLIASAAGIPISTTYMKTFSMLGAAGADGRRPDRGKLLPIIIAWAATYPVCMLLSYALCAGAEYFFLT